MYSITSVCLYSEHMYSITSVCLYSEHKELREYIDEHYQKEPELYVQSPREEAAMKRSAFSLP